MSTPAAAHGLLAGKHALITGAGRGIGAVIATTLAREGARTSLLGRDGASLEQVAAQAGGQDRSRPFPTDVTDADAVRDAFSSARALFGPVHILINNAGQAASAKFTDTDERLWTRLLSVNLTGTFLCTRQAITDMLQEGFGRVVNIASMAGLRGAPYIAAYASSKHAVIGLTRSLALEYATRHITVNAVCPGFVDTDIVRHAIADISAKTGRSESEALAALVAANPQRRLIEPREVADIVLWLCAPGAQSVTGQSIVLGGEPA
ncbi:MAG TPA: SDR family oxidoreductase [Steroidobacteraceae bacterium]|jgi:NAD(P)-dependent dehydrogenase (short-subunit alcohol dehydrogenase family)